MHRPTIIRIHLSSIAHNLAVAQSQFKGCFTWAVVKANAYGHSLLDILPALEQADGLALLEMDMALTLRQKAISKPLLLLEGAFSYEESCLIVHHNLIPVIHQQQQITWLERAYAQYGSKPLTVYIKVNTGMNRLGFTLEKITPVLEYLSALPWIEHMVLMTHFAESDQPQGFLSSLEQFNSIPWNGLTSIANTATTLGWSSLHQQSGFPGNMLRIGIGLYGSSPFNMISASTLNLQAAMSFEAGIISIQDLKPGQTVGYGSSFIAKQPMRIGIIACGYADGYPRHAPTGTPVWLENHPSYLIGRISMDMLAVDITHCPTATIGSMVELWGMHIPIDLVAQHAKTISYELMCGITARVQREYIPLST